MNNCLKSKRIRMIVIAVFILAIFCMLLAACNEGAKDDTRLREEGFMRVTFNCNGGKIGNYTERFVYAMPNSFIPEPGKVKELDAPVLGSYDDLLGWYTGEVVDGEVVLNETAWNFKTDKIGNEDIVLYAKWTKQLRFVVRFGENYENEETVRYISHFAPENERFISRPAREPMLDGSTFIEYYLDPELTIPCQFPIKHEGTVENNTMTIYAKFIEGNYRVVYSPESLLQIGTFTNIYLMNDIDMSNYTWNMPQNYQGTFDGNGFSVKNIKFGAKQLGNSLKFGLFGSLNGATFKNVSFENCQVAIMFNLSNSSVIASAGLFASEISENTVFENVSVSGNVSVVFNIPSLNQALRADTLRYDNDELCDGLIGYIPTGYDLSGVEVNIEKSFMYSSSAELQELEAEGYLSVVLDADGGNLSGFSSGIAYLYMEANTTMIKPGMFTTILDNPTKRNENNVFLDFEGWFIQNELDNEWDFNDKIINNITLVAKWGER